MFLPASLGSGYTLCCVDGQTMLGYSVWAYGHGLTALESGRQLLYSFGGLSAVRQASPPISAGALGMTFSVAAVFL